MILDTVLGYFFPELFRWTWQKIYKLIASSKFSLVCWQTIKNWGQGLKYAKSSDFYYSAGLQMWTKHKINLTRSKCGAQLPDITFTVVTTPCKTERQTCGWETEKKNNWDVDVCEHPLIFSEYNWRQDTDKVKNTKMKPRNFLGPQSRISALDSS